MRLLLYNCDTGFYVENGFYGELEGCVLTLNDNNYFEVKIDLSPAVKTQAKKEGRNLNLMLIKSCSDCNDHSAKYFTNVTYVEKLQILWMYRQTQLNKINIPQAIVVAVSAFILLKLVTILGISSN